MKESDPQWATFVLEDLRAFFDANGMHSSADAVVDALRVVRRETDAIRSVERVLPTGARTVQ